MGVVRKQSIGSSILFYLGAGLGFVNKILLFTKFLSPEEVGLANILVTLGALYAQFSALGYVNVILRFFPYFKNKKDGHHGFLFWALIISFIGFLLITVVFIVGKPVFVERFSDSSPLLVDYYYYLLPLGFFTLYYNIFEAYFRFFYKAIVPVLLQEVVQKVFISLSVLIYAVGWVNFEGFVIIYVGLICMVTVLMVAYAAFLGQLQIKPKFTWRFRMLNKRMLIFSGFALLGNVSAILIYNIDSLMLADMKGMAEVGIYTTSFYVTALLLIPWKAIQKTTSPLVATYWKDGKLVEMDRLYKRTSLINFVLGSFLFLTMITNTDSLFELMPKAYRGGFMVMFYIGLARVVEMMTGLNGYILVTSRLYRYDLFFNILLVLLTILTNLYFIPIMGIEGAALATMISFVSSNVFRLAFIWYHFGLHPFTFKMLYVLAITGVAFLAQYLIPDLGTFWIDLPIRVAVLTGVYATLTILFKVTPDANNLIKLIQGKIKPFIKRDL
jgi:O-antigen/teichoic acid export membrane protein